MERLIENLLKISAYLTLLLVFFIVFFLFFLGFPLIKQEGILSLIFSSWSLDKNLYGIAPMIVGSFLITFLSLIFAFPLSIGCAGFMITTESRFIKKFLSSFVFITLAIPPVIYGFVGLSVIVPIFREILKEGSGMCILTASFVLSLLVSPTMIIFFMTLLNLFR